jgi:hypothetical protein
MSVKRGYERRICRNGRLTQKDRDAVRALEAYLEPRSASTSSPTRRPGRVCSGRHRSEPATACIAGHAATTHAGSVHRVALELCRGRQRRRNVETELVDIRLVYQAAGQAEARRDLNVAHFFDLMLPIPFEPLLKYLRRGSLVNFGKLLEGE